MYWRGNLKQWKIKLHNYNKYKYPKIVIRVFLYYITVCKKILTTNFFLVSSMLDITTSLERMLQRCMLLSSDARAAAALFVLCR